jgi:hypothetical protein
MERDLPVSQSLTDGGLMLQAFASAEPVRFGGPSMAFLSRSARVVCIRLAYSEKAKVFLLIFA